MNKKTITPVLKIEIFSLFLFIFLCGCQTNQKINGFVDGKYNWNQPLRVAIIPFENDANDVPLKRRQQVSKHFYNEFYKSFSLLNFTDLDPQIVNNYMLQNKLETRKLIANPQLLKKFYKNLNVDIVVTCHIKNQMYVNALLYEYWKSDLRCIIWDAKSARTILSGLYDETEHRWHFSTSPLGAAGEVIDIAVRDPVYDTVVRNLCDKVVRTIPNPQYNQKPEIFLIAREPYDKTLIFNDKATIQVKATPQLDLKYRLNNQEKEYSFKEIERGIYKTSFIVDDNVPDGNVSIFVDGTNTIGNSTETAKFKDAFRVDRTPPPIPQKVVLSSDKQAIWLNWSNENVSDFKHYLIYRKSEREDKFAQIAIVSKNSFLDTDIIPFKKYKYKIRSVDKLGNISGFSQAQEKAFIKKGPFHLDERTKFIPNVFYKEASPYIINGNIKIPKGTQLRIEPGVVVNIDEGNIQVEGDFIALASKDSPIIFNYTGENKTVGLSLKNGGRSDISHTKFNNFATVIQVESSKLYIENSTFNSSEQSIVLREQSICKIEKSKFSNNDVALVLLNGSKINIKNCHFINNKRNINLKQKSTAKLDSNWWGRELPEKYSKDYFNIDGDFVVHNVLDSEFGTPLNTKSFKDFYQFKNTEDYKIKIELCKKLINKSPYFKDSYIWLVDFLYKNKFDKEAKAISAKLFEIYPNEKNFK